MQHEVKLQQKFKELVFRGGEIQFFPRPAVYLQLNRVYVFVGQFPEVGPFRDVLAYKLVGVLDGPFLP